MFAVLSRNLTGVKNIEKPSSSGRLLGSRAAEVALGPASS
jgi:hypothetical protein